MPRLQITPSTPLATNSATESRYRWPRIALAATLAVGLWPVAGQADDFVYETSIFQDSSRTPIESHTTLFAGESVYDWTETSALVADFANRKVVLLDSKRQLQTTLDFATLEWRLGRKKLAMKQFMQQSKSDSERALFNFLLDPVYDITGDAESVVVGFSDRRVKYQVSVTKPADGDTRQKLARFLDVSTRLSALQSPWGFSRMPINDWLNERGMVPTRVERETSEGATAGRKSLIRSQHRIRTELIDLDQTKIDEIQFWLKDFTAVDFDKYHEAQSR